MSEYNIEDMIEEAYSRIETQFLSVFITSRENFEEMVKEHIRKYLEHPFNVNYKSHNYDSNDLLITYAASQCNPGTHPLTCGVNSSHDLLVPRKLYQGQTCLVCPTCGYVQMIGA